MNKVKFYDNCYGKAATYIYFRLLEIGLIGTNVRKRLQKTNMMRMNVPLHLNIILKIKTYLKGVSFPSSISAICVRSFPF